MNRSPCSLACTHVYACVYVCKSSTSRSNLNLQIPGAGVKGSASCQYHSTFEMLQRIYRDPSLLRSHSNGVFFWKGHRIQDWNIQGIVFTIVIVHATGDALGFGVRWHLSALDVHIDVPVSFLHVRHYVVICAFHI